MSPDYTRNAPPLGPAARRAAAAREADESKQLARELDRLTAEINRYRIAGQRFFAGDLALPPDEQREKIAAVLRRLQASRSKGTVESFRLNALEAQFNSHTDLFGRRLRERERSSRPGVKPAPAHDPIAGVIIGERGAPGAVEALYQGMFLAGERKPTMDLERFRSYLDQQATAIRKKTGCADITFRLAQVDGKLKLKARPLRRP